MTIDVQFKSCADIKQGELLYRRDDGKWCNQAGQVVAEELKIKSSGADKISTKEFNYYYLGKIEAKELTSGQHFIVNERLYIFNYLDSDFCAEYVFNGDYGPQGLIGDCLVPRRFEYISKGNEIYATIKTKGIPWLYDAIKILNEKEPSPERKEMELKVGNWYSLKNPYIQRDNFYQLLSITSECKLKNRYSSNSFEIDINKFISDYEPTVPPVRKLKLEDLKKLWVTVDYIYSIVNFDKDYVYLKSMSHGCYNSPKIHLEKFYNEFREATQTDIDNLTKEK